MRQTTTSNKIHLILGVNEYYSNFESQLIGFHIVQKGTEDDDCQGGERNT